ncbi:hypothetical protein NDU88_006809 [Pleurodeles waltl]|uniref:Uncharacterized protein n=1 Tax=Pleurodeles waltl TaxID=8319 RepID=A0AAV7X4V5_PLEWA|nr:hypothetical protein NDU88_006809 [Pleurodeles waltl]
MTLLEIYGKLCNSVEESESSDDSGSCLAVNKPADSAVQMAHTPEFSDCGDTPALSNNIIEFSDNEETVPVSSEFMDFSDCEEIPAVTKIVMDFSESLKIFSVSKQTVEISEKEESQQSETKQPVIRNESLLLELDTVAASTTDPDLLIPANVYPVFSSTISEEQISELPVSDLDVKSATPTSPAVSLKLKTPETQQSETEAQVLKDIICPTKTKDLNLNLVFEDLMISTVLSVLLQETIINSKAKAEALDNNVEAISEETPVLFQFKEQPFSVNRAEDQLPVVETPCKETISDTTNTPQSTCNEEISVLSEDHPKELVCGTSTFSYVNPVSKDMKTPIAPEFDTPMSSKMKDNSDFFMFTLRTPVTHVSQVSMLCKPQTTINANTAAETDISCLSEGVTDLTNTPIMSSKEDSTEQETKVPNDTTHDAIPDLLAPESTSPETNSMHSSRINRTIKRKDIRAHMGINTCFAHWNIHLWQDCKLINQEQIKPKEEESSDADSNSCTLRNQDMTLLEIYGKLCNSVEESESSDDSGSCLAVNKPADSAVQMAHTPEFSDCGDTPALSNNIIEFSDNEETVPVSSEFMDFSDCEEIPAVTKIVMDFSESLKIFSVSKQTVEISEKEESQQSETKQPVIRNESLLLELDTVAASTTDPDLLIPANVYPVFSSTISEEQISELPVSDLDVKSATPTSPAVSLKLKTPETQQSETEAQVLKDIICPTKTKDLNLNLVFEDLMISTVLSVLLQETIINSKAKAEALDNNVEAISEETPVLFQFKEQPFSVNRAEDQLPVVETPCKETISDTTNTPQSTCNEEISVLSEDHPKELVCGTSTFSYVNPVSKDMKTPIAPEFDTPMSSKMKDNSDFFMFTLRTPVTHVSQVSMLCKPQTTINANTAAETDISCLSEGVTDLTNTPIMSSKEDSTEQETKVPNDTTHDAISDLLAPESTSPETNSMHSSRINRTIKRKDIRAHMGINTCFAHWNIHLWQDCKLINQEQIKPKEEESSDADSNSCTLRNQDMTLLEIYGKLCNSVEESESSDDSGSCLAVNKPADSAVQMAHTPEFSDCGDTPALSNNIIEFSDNEETVPVSSEFMDFSDCEEIPAVTKIVMDFSESLKIFSVSKQTVEISEKEESQQSETKQPVIRNESLLLELDTVAASTTDPDLLIPANVYPVFSSTISEEQISELPVSDLDVKSATPTSPAVSLKLKTPETQQSETEAQVLKDIICPTKTKDLNLNLVFEDLMISTVLSVLLQETIINSKAKAEALDNNVEAISEETPVLFQFKEQPFSVNRAEDQLPVVETPCKETISDTTNTPQSTCNEEISVLSEDHPKELVCGTSTFSYVNPVSKDMKTPIAPEFDTPMSSKMKDNSDFFMFTLRTPVTHVSQVSMLCKPQTTINANTAAETDISCLSEGVTDLTNTPIMSSKEDSTEQETKVPNDTTHDAIPDLLAPESTSPETNSMHSSRINRTIKRKDIRAHMGINTCFAHWNIHLWQDCKLINQGPLNVTISVPSSDKLWAESDGQTLLHCRGHNKGLIL